MGLREILLLGAIFGVGYWYYENHVMRGDGDLREVQWETNRKAMTECMAREERLANISGNAGVVRDTSNVQGRCAEELGVYWDDGHWHSF